MSQSPSGAQAPPQNEASAERSSHRRGSDIEGLSRPGRDRQGEEQSQNDETAEIEQAPEGPPVDETDVLSMGGPDSLEDVEDDSERDDIER